MYGYFLPYHSSTHFYYDSLFFAHASITMKPSIIVRKATLKDMPEIASMLLNRWLSSDIPEKQYKILNKLFREELKKRLRRQLKQKSILYVITKKTIHGFVLFSPYMRDGIEIKKIYIVPDKRREGLGSQLFQSVVKQAKTLKKKKMITWVLDTNKQAIQFYEQLGFIISNKQRLEHLDNNITIKEVALQMILE